MVCPKTCIIQLDVNCDGLYTITDVVAWVLKNPGDWVMCLTMAYAPRVATFFEWNVSSLQGNWSLALSLLVWFSALVAIMFSVTLVEIIKEIIKKPRAPHGD